MSNPFYDSSKKIHLRTGEEAYENHLTRVKNESKEGKKTKKSKKVNILQKGFLELPDYITLKSDNETLFVAKKRLIADDEVGKVLDNLGIGYNKNGLVENINWYQAHKILQSLNSQMLTLRQFNNFLRALQHDKLYDGLQNLVSEKEREEIFKEITEVRDPYRAEWLDADFKVVNEKLHIKYNHILDSNGKLVPQNSEPLEECIMKDGPVDLSLFNKQGLPTKKGNSFHYWYPRSDNNSVARFGASSNWVGLGCVRYPDGSNAGLGVRRAQKINSK